MTYDIFSVYDIPFLITAICYLGVGLYNLTRGRLNSTSRLYSVLCLVTAIWQSLWVFLIGHVSGPQIFTIVKWAFIFIVFVPSIFYHFLVDFSREVKFRSWILPAYCFSIIIAVLIASTNLILKGTIRYSWGLAARAGPLHPVLVVFAVVIIWKIWKLFREMESHPPQYDIQAKQRRLIRIATFAYAGGSLDYLSNYGCSLYPLSFAFTGIALFLIGIAIIRYEFLGKRDVRQTTEELARQEAARNEMRRTGMTAAFPLVSQGELLGYLLLGEKMSEESYSHEDLLLLRIVANQAALAYQRVRYLEMAVHGARTEMVGEIAGGFAHEIKTPLANISLPAELSLLDLSDLEKGERSLAEVLPELRIRLKDIMNQTVKASEKIEAIRQFSKPGQQVRLEPVSMHKILGNSLALLDHLLKVTHVVVRSEIPEKLPLVQGDPKQLEIVFVNLIKNAAEAMAQHSSSGLARELCVKAKEEGDWVVASIKDSGPGIKRGDVGHLFEAYFTTKGSEGTGMGLFLSQQVIKAHGGSIDVRSEEGQGTEFIIRLPKTAAQSTLLLHTAA